MKHVSPDDHRKNLIKLIERSSYRHAKWDVFSDFCELAAISISNAVDKPPFTDREARYFHILKRYNKEEVDRFPQMLAELVLALEDAVAAGTGAAGVGLDVLGTAFHDLELHNRFKGQYFTPYPICQMMAKMSLGTKDDLDRMIAERGFISAAEPACGSGAMVLALAMAMKDGDVNPQQCLHVTATDLDGRCCHMAYIQLSLLHIPAIVQHGNSLSMEEFGRWKTPAHILGGWDFRTRRSPANALLGPAGAGDTGKSLAPDEKPAPLATEAAPSEPITLHRKLEQLTLF